MIGGGGAPATPLREANPPDSSCILQSLHRVHRFVFHPTAHSWISALDSLPYIPCRLDVGERTLEALALKGLARMAAPILAS